LWIWVRETSLIVYFKYCNYLFINQLNGMNVYVLYYVVSMFVNDVVCDRDIVSSGKEIPVLRLLGYALFGDS